MSREQPHQGQQQQALAVAQQLQVQVQVQVLLQGRGRREQACRQTFQINWCSINQDNCLQVTTGTSTQQGHLQPGAILGWWHDTTTTCSHLQRLCLLGLLRQG